MLYRALGQLNSSCTLGEGWGAGNTYNCTKMLIFLNYYFPVTFFIFISFFFHRYFFHVCFCFIIHPCLLKKIWNLCLSSNLFRCGHLTCTHNNCLENALVWCLISEYLEINWSQRNSSKSYHTLMSIHPTMHRKVRESNKFHHMAHLWQGRLNYHIAPWRL